MSYKPSLKKFLINSTISYFNNDLKFSQVRRDTIPVILSYVTECYFKHTFFYNWKRIQYIMTKIIYICTALIVINGDDLFGCIFRGINYITKVSIINKQFHAYRQHGKRDAGQLLLSRWFVWMIYFTGQHRLDFSSQYVPPKQYLQSRKVNLN